MTSQQRLTVGALINAIGLIALAALAYQTWGLIGAAVTAVVSVAFVGGYAV